MSASVVTFKLIDGSEVKGNLYVIDPVTQTVVVRTVDKANEFTIINPAQIASVDGVLDTSLTFSNVSEKSINAHTLEKLESKVVEQAERLIAGLNNQVSNEVQMLYDRLSLIFPCKWGEGNSMVVLDDFVVQVPYESVVSSKGGDGIDRVRKVLEMERKKLGLTA